MNYPRPGLLAETDWLAERLGDPSVRIVDCSFPDAFKRAHIPGAVGLPVHHYIKEPDPAGGEFGVLVMSPPDFEALMGGLGIGNDTAVVAYDDDNARVATRLWWVLNYYGHSNVKVLNGGWHGWLSEGRPVTFETSAPPPATFRARTVPEIHASCEYLLGRLSDPARQVLDARSDGEWFGREDRGNRRVGHVPGAKHLEWVRFVASDSFRRFLPAAELQSLMDEAGIVRGKETVTYCQGGIRAAHAAFALALLGYDNVRVYDGSMKEWANRDDTPLTIE